MPTRLFNLREQLVPTSGAFLGSTSICQSSLLSSLAKVAEFY